VLPVPPLPPLYFVVPTALEVAAAVAPVALVAPGPPFAQAAEVAHVLLLVEVLRKVSPPVTPAPPPEPTPMAVEAPWTKERLEIFEYPPPAPPPAPEEPPVFPPPPPPMTSIVLLALFQSFGTVQVVDAVLLTKITVLPAAWAFCMLKVPARRPRPARSRTVPPKPESSRNVTSVRKSASWRSNRFLSLVDNFMVFIIRLTHMATDTKKRIQKIEREIEKLWKTMSEISPFLPFDKLENYDHPDRIQRSYQKAIKKYPHGGNQNGRL
jgi:hypothetical protein